jgi:hypothetical protein
MDNPQKLATLGTQDKDKQEHSKQHNTLCVGYRYTQQNTNNVSVPNVASFCGLSILIFASDKMKHFKVYQ